MHVSPTCQIYLDHRLLSVQDLSQTKQEFSAAGMQIYIIHNSADIDRCLYVRLLILRPCLFMRERNDLEVKYRSQLSGLEQKVLSEMCRLCISTAISIIDILHEHIRGPLRSPSWHALYCEYFIYVPIDFFQISSNLT